MSTQDTWRDLALKFDAHRMQALWHLQAMLEEPEAHAETVFDFLRAAPLDGALLKDRLITEYLQNNFEPIYQLRRAGVRDWQNVPKEVFDQLDDQNRRIVYAPKVTKTAVEPGAEVW